MDCNPIKMIRDTDAMMDIATRYAQHVDELGYAGRPYSFDVLCPIKDQLGNWSCLIVYQTVRGECTKTLEVCGEMVIDRQREMIKRSIRDRGVCWVE